MVVGARASASRAGGATDQHVLCMRGRRVCRVVRKSMRWFTRGEQLVVSVCAQRSVAGDLMRNGERTMSVSPCMYVCMNI